MKTITKVFSGGHKGNLIELAGGEEGRCHHTKQKSPGDKRQEHMGNAPQADKPAVEGGDDKKHGKKRQLTDAKLRSCV